MSNIDKIASSIAASFNSSASKLGSIKDKIVEGIKFSTEKLGIKLVHSEWGSSHEGAACALGCMLLANDKYFDLEDGDTNEMAAAEYLGVDKEWVTAFITGFDGGFVSNNCDTDAVALGTQLREDLSPTNGDGSEDDEVEDDDCDDDCDCDDEDDCTDDNSYPKVI